jgi:hypothetical protein
MLHINNPIIKHKAGLINLAQELQNVSKACKVMGVSRDTFYRYQELVAEGGVEALIDKSCRTPNLKNRVESAVKPMQSNFRLMVSTEPAMNYASKASSFQVAVFAPYG